MKATKILAGACASLMLATTAIPTVSAADAVSVTVGNAKAEAGGTFSVTVDLADIPATGINGCDFGIEYDSEALTITSVKAGALAKDDTAALEGVNTLETGIEAGLVSIIYGNTSDVMTGSGTFVTLEGKVSNTAAAGKYDLTVVAVDRLADPNGTAANADIIFGYLGADSTDYTVYTPTIVNGYVEVEGEEATTPSETTPVETTPSVGIGEATLLGDVNLDGRLTAVDATVLAKYRVAPTVYTLTAEQLANGDVDQNKEITAADTMALIEFALGSITSFESLAAK